MTHFEDPPSDFWLRKAQFAGGGAMLIMAELLAVPSVVDLVEVGGTMGGGPEVESPCELVSTVVVELSDYPRI